jgi:hypothetical protein
MQRAGSEALFVGTGGVVGAYTGLDDVGTASVSECLEIAGWIADSVEIPVIMALLTAPINGAAALRRAGKGNIAAVEAIRAGADRHAADMLPVIEDIHSSGVSSLKGIAAELNSRGILTARGGQWHATTVRNLLARS